VNLYLRVACFFRKFGQAAPDAPSVPDVEVIRNRCMWQLEETLELLAACYGGDVAAIESAACELVGLIRWAPVKVDLVAYADANADIRYVAYGNDIAAGIDSRETDAEIARSNDSKSPPSAPGGKVQKGAGYSPPALAGILREQGWGR